MGLRTVFTGHKRARMNTIVLFYPRVPQLFTKGWPTHTKNIAAKWWRRLQQLPLVLCAKRRAQSLRSAGLPQFCCKLCDSSKRLFFPIFISFSLSSAWQAANQSAGQPPFSWHDLHRPPLSPPKISFYTVILSALKNATILSHKRRAA